MPLVKVPRKVLAGALLAAAVLGAAPDAPRAQVGTGGNAAARILEHPSEARAAAQMRRARSARQHHRFQRLRMEQAAAHRQMPDTLYASTPDRSSPPHPFPLDVNLESAPERASAPAQSGAGRGHRIAFFPAASRWTGERCASTPGTMRGRTAVR